MYDTHAAFVEAGEETEGKSIKNNRRTHVEILRVLLCLRTLVDSFLPAAAASFVVFSAQEACE